MALRLALLQDLMIESLSLFILDLCLTFLSSVCISFTPNQVFSLVHSYHPVVSLCFCRLLHATILPYGCSYVIDFEQVPYMVLIHFWAMLFWSRTWPQEPLCSIYISERRFRSHSVPVGNPALIGLDLPLIALVSVIGRKRKILTYTQMNQNHTKQKLERLHSTRLIHCDPKATNSRHAKASVK
jgi:hypothetical protein